MKGIPRALKIASYVGGMLITGLVTTGLNQVFIEELQARLNSGGRVINSDDTLTHEEKTDIYREGVSIEMEGIRDTLYQSIDSAYAHFNILYNMLSRPGSDECAIGFRSSPRHDTIKWRDENCELFVTKEIKPHGVRKYYNPNCFCFMATTIPAMTWDQYLETIMNNQ